MTTIHTSGNARPYQYRPSADKLGNAPHVYGALQPMQTERRSFLARIWGK